jgi:hypothetical protein
MVLLLRLAFGWARNLRDGHAEVIAEGGAEAVDKLVASGQLGPSLSVGRRRRTSVVRTTLSLKQPCPVPLSPRAGEVEGGGAVGPGHLATST